MTKEELKEAHILYKNLCLYEEELHRIKLVLESAPTPLYKEIMGSPSHRNESKIEDGVITMIEYEQLIQETIQKYTAKKMKLVKEIEELKSLTEKFVMLRRYVSGKDFKEIADRLKMSESAIYKIHSRAVRKLENL